MSATLMKPVYLLSLFYTRKIEDQQAAFLKIAAAVRDASKSDMLRIESDVNHSAIAFTSDLSYEDLIHRLRPIFQEEVSSLLTEVAALTGTTISAAQIDWFRVRLPAKDRKPR